jgi:transcriptional regulator with XRE-family HTH domain
VSTPGRSGIALADRLRELRTRRRPSARRITQGEIGRALRCSPPLISSWENGGAIPSTEQLADYATLFATERSFATKPPYRLLELTATERVIRDQILGDLVDLRDAVVAEQRTASAESSMSHGSWYFPDGGEVTIVCAKLPERLRPRLAAPRNPDYAQMYAVADPDSLIELFGHIRATNPASRVTFTTDNDFTAEHSQNHLVLLGGVDWNSVTRNVEARLNMPVRQSRRPEDDDSSGFELRDEPDHRVLEPVMDGHVLIEDIGYFFRAPSPYDATRTVTICNGIHGLGTYGVVRALTHDKVRDVNEKYLQQRFHGVTGFGVLTRVPVVGGVATSPNWTLPESLLYEWSVG